VPILLISFNNIYILKTNNSLNVSMIQLKVHSLEKRYFMGKKLLVYIFVFIIANSLVGCKNDTVEEPSTYLVTFDVQQGDPLSPVEVQDGESLDLPIPTRDGYTFLGWTLTNNENAEIVSNSLIIHSNLTLYAKWSIQEKDWSDVLEYVKDVLPETVSNSISLPSDYKEYSILWESSNPEIISNTGKYTRPYQKTSITLNATIQFEDQEIVRSYPIEVEGYKSLNVPIASSYIYRDYNFVDDTFFNTLDIINCAFITADSDGDLSGTSVLNNINIYIMPKAKKYGNWVIFSIAPDSDWSDIVSSSTKMNYFADNIVSMINEYGFDGVDIDWETPSPSEASKFTDLMEIIYTKVKDNNPNHIVSAAIAGGMWQPPNYDLLHSGQYIDYINMMTYGMVSTNGYYQNALFKSSAYDNPTNNAGKTLGSCSIEESVQIYNSYGISNNKIIVGVAFYGIKQTRTYDDDTNSWSNWGNPESVSYDYINNVYLNNSKYNYYYDNNAGVPYIISTDGTTFISYDNPRSISDKSAYIIENGLAGMMYWENGLDSTGSLLIAIESGLKDHK
jgi:chitinase